MARRRQPKADRVIKSKYRRVWVIGRTLATDAADQQKAQKLMAKYELTLPNGKERTLPTRAASRASPEMFPTPTDGPGFISALNQALADNPPPKRDDPLLAQLEPLGVGAGLSPEDAGLAPDVLAALYKGVADRAAGLPTAARLCSYTEALKTQGWLLPASNIGDYGTDYEFRAIIATVGLGANTPDEAIYPTGIADGDGELYDGANAYRLTFAPGEAPPAKYFWSITMYDSTGYLVANPADRYSLGPSHPPLRRAAGRLDRDRDPADRADRARRQLAAGAADGIPAEPAPLRPEPGRALRRVAPAGRRKGRLSPATSAVPDRCHRYTP